jgi:hypothetical protein
MEKLEKYLVTINRVLNAKEIGFLNPAPSHAEKRP